MFDRSIPVAWLLLALALLSPLSQAETNPSAVLRDLHAAQMSLQATASAFHRYQGSEGDSKLLVKLNEALGDLKSRFQVAYQDLHDMGMTKELDQLRGHWKEAARDLNSAITAIAGSGFAEGQIINGYLLNSYYSGNDLKSAYNAVVSTTGLKVPPVLQSLRDEAVLFREMSALYMEQSTAQYGYTYRSEAGDSDTLDKMAQRFARNLDQIEKQMAGNPDGIKKLNNIRNKWQFLEKSFMNYTENSVPYLVVKFGGEIIEDLEALSAAFDKG